MNQNKLHNISIPLNTEELRRKLEESGYKRLGGVFGNRIIASRSGTYVCGNSATPQNPRFRYGYHSYGKSDLANFLATAHLMIRGF